MPNRINKSNFNALFLGKQIPLDNLKNDGRVKNNEFDRLKHADLNGDGNIKGKRELNSLFKQLDHFDSDGNRNSLFSTDLVKATVDAARNTDTVDRHTFNSLLNNKRITLQDLQLQPNLSNEVMSSLKKADLNRDGEISGTDETNKLFKQLDHFDHDGHSNTMKRTDTINTVLSSAKDIPPPEPGEAVFGSFNFQPNKTALKKARTSGLGKKVISELPKNFAAYSKASELTGVPVELIAAVHANESQMGTYRSSTRGPESGFGLDPRHVTTSWANDKLKKHGLGTWKRGQAGSTALLQSSVVAAEHIKRQAKFAGITIKKKMSKAELAGVVTSYVQGPGAGRRARRRGSSWLFKTNDSNPHPRHPGGTSIGRGGRVIRVRASRKEGLLRWDTLLPLIQENTKKILHPQT